MILSRKSSAWLLFGLQAAFALMFASQLLPLTGPLSDSPSWLTVLLGLQFGLAAVLALTVLWRFELTAIVLLFALHIVCPLLFFTDLTRNPYYTQIVLLNVWVAFLWIAWLWDGAQSGRLFLPRTPIDLPLGAFLGVCTLSWALSFFSHTSSFYPSMIAEGSRRWLSGPDDQYVRTVAPEPVSSGCLRVILTTAAATPRLGFVRQWWD